MADGADIPAEAVSIVRDWCKHHHGLVAWCGARCERPGDYPVDVFLVLQGADEDTRGRLALDLHDYLARFRGPDEAEPIFAQLHLSREEYLEDLALLGVPETAVRPVWPGPPS
jgi:hypothetical protein